MMTVVTKLFIYGGSWGEKFHYDLRYTGKSDMEF